MALAPPSPIHGRRWITSSLASPEGRDVVIVTTLDLNEYVYEALRAGASGFSVKDAPAAQLATAIRVVADGDALLAPSITRRLITEFARRPAPNAKPEGMKELTPRELEVLRLVARGLSNAEIAKELFVSDATIKTHVARVLMKLRLRDRVQAVVAAYESGLVQPAPPDARTTGESEPPGWVPVVPVTGVPTIH